MRLALFGICCFVAALIPAGNTVAVADPPKKQTDEEINKLLVGKWIVDEGDGQKEPKIKGVVQYKKDGTVEAEATVEIKNETVKVVISGTWKVADGVVTETVTKSNVPELIKEGLVTKDKVISVDDKEYKYKDDMGKEKSHKRKKD
jgi:hypothetical protein